MILQPLPEPASSGGLFAAIARTGVPAPRPTLLTVLLLLIAVTILLSGAIDLYLVDQQVTYDLGNESAEQATATVMQMGKMMSILFGSTMMLGALGVFAFGYGWARWVWLILFVILGGLGSLVSLIDVFAFAPPMAYAKVALYVVYFVTACMLFSPTSNAWYRQVTALRARNAPHRPVAQVPHGAPAPAQPHHPYAPPVTQVRTEVVLPPRPLTIKLGIGLSIGSSLSGSILSLFFMPQIIASQPVTFMSEWMAPIMYASMAFGTCIVLAIMFGIWRGANPARWVWAALAAFGVVAMISGFSMNFKISTAFGVCGLICQAITLTGLVFLFRPDSNQWMRAAEQARRR